MSDSRHFLALVGSPKMAKSTSGSLANYMFGRMPEEGVVKDIIHVGKALRKEELWNELTTDLDAADTVILIFPLYWDGLPSHLVRGLERLRARRRSSAPGKPQQLVAIVNNGFCEPEHNETAVDICKIFAKEMGFDWSGGLIVAGGAAINGRPLEEVGGMTRRLRESLDLAVEHMVRGDPIPKDVADKVAKQLYPAWVNIIFGGLGYRYEKRRVGGKGSLRARPYARRE